MERGDGAPEGGGGVGGVGGNRSSLSRGCFCASALCEAPIVSGMRKEDGAWWRVWGWMLEME